MEDPMKNYVADLTPLFEGIDQDWLLEQVQHHYPEHKEQTVEYLANVLATSDYPKKAKEVMFDLTQGNAENLAAAYLDKQKTVEEIKNLFADVDEEWLDQHYDAIKKKNPGKDRDFIASTWTVLKEKIPVQAQPRLTRNQSLGSQTLLARGCSSIKITKRKRR
jgi:hypothetical protein